MRRLAKALAFACLVLAANPDRGAAQQHAYPGPSDSYWKPSSNTVVISDGQAPYAPVSYGQEIGPVPVIDEGYLDGTHELWLGDCRDTLCDGAMLWGSYDVLGVFQQSRQVPPLITTSPAGSPSTPQSDAGVLGLPNTSTILGNDGLEDDPSFGMRGELGIWLKNSGGRQGFGASMMYLPESENGYSASSGGNTILARPFFDTLTEQPASQLVAYPGIVSGTVNVRGGTEIYDGELFLRRQIGACPMTPRVFLLTSEVGMCGRRIFNLPGMQRIPGLQRVGNVLCNVLTTPPQTRVDLITGYQFNRVDDRLSIGNTLVSLDPSFLGQIGTTLDAFDRFETRNEFHGGTLGLKSVSRFGCWTLSLFGKVGLGSMLQQVTIDGLTTVTLPGGPSSTNSGGLLAQSANIGNIERNQFSVIPEARISLSYDLTCQLKMGVGYQFTYWESIALASDQITQVDISQAPSNVSLGLQESDFLVHAGTLFLHWNY